MSSDPPVPSGDLQRVNTILYCDRWAKTVRFYRDVLGLAIVHETDWFVEFRLREGAFLSVADAARATVPSAGGAGITLSLQVEDLEGAHRRLSRTGAKPTPVRRIWGTLGCFLHDPEGHRIELWAPDPATARK